MHENEIKLAFKSATGVLLPTREHELMHSEADRLDLELEFATGVPRTLFFHAFQTQLVRQVAELQS